MGFLSLLSSTLFLSLALGSPQAQVQNAQTDSKSKPPTTGAGTGTGVKLADNLERDKQTIQEFAKKVTEDPQGVLKSWQGDDPCKFKGFKCDKTPKGYWAVSALDFNGFHLGGPDMVLEGLLDKLVDIAIFHANSNKFVKTVPDNLAQITWFYELDLSNNQLSGEFPKGVLTAKQLTFLDLRYNQFEGSVPSEVFHMDLDVLFLNNNKFTGSIASDLGASPALYITLANNQFDGSLPSELNNMKGLKEILFLGNKFSGSLPTELGGMAALTLFDASDNQLSGTIPESLCGLPKLEKLVLKNNQFAEDLGPKCLDALNKKKLDVAGNCIKNAPNQKPGCGTGKDDSKGTGSTNTDRTRLVQTNGNAPQGKPS
ncbi:uncharacterized protein J3D65DRAFT_618008 [Phyllosticta citribraziliensis]|uniref:Cell wall hydroxyproline-rich glycoprotein n=1 Tax=Phyllosticta citribraziliensis TaxID=989973 RepID=A0ABR1M1G0_9PEZI